MSQPDDSVRSPTTAVPKDRRLSTVSDSDSDKDNVTTPQQDAFEDAVVDVAEVAEVAEVRSLTTRTPSVSKAPPTEPPTEPEPPKKEAKEDSDVDDDAPPTPPKDEPAVTENQKTDDEENEIKRKPSPVSHRLSDTSNLDNVSLDDNHHSAAPQDPEPKASDPVPPKVPTKKISISSITGALPSLPWSPPAEPAKSPVAPAAPLPQAAPAPPPVPVSHPGPPTRKLTSPFSWLSRNSGSKEKETSPPPASSPRRNTASSIATLTSNPEMMLSRLDEEKEGDHGVPRHSLKDRFKMVRMREEAGITLDDDKTPIPPPKGLGLSTPPAQQNGDKELGAEPPKSPLPTTPNPALAPGTVSGVSAGPSDMPDAQVDWDLWQSVVYEGPAVVARTSAEELNRAIATGIPSAIRGVIWQVLAQSNSEELEMMYRDLITRGTDKEKNRNSNSTLSSGSNGNLSIHHEAVNSSASSIHSEHSAVNGNGTTSPNEKSAEAVQKAQQAAAAARQKKQKEDAAMIQKLEKTIRRDMGARTSFSKYAAAAGLQEGLFGVCKAYALYDEAVGYAQGMNFLIMPLLFNMTEEEAFCLLVKLMNHYQLRDLFVQDMPGLHKNLYIFERLLEDFEPALYCHLRRRSISPHLYATQWFLTLFAYRFPLQLVLRIYDLIFSEGLSAILRFGIVLMQKNAANLLAISDMQQLTVFLKDKLFDAYIDTAPSAGSILENGFFGSSSASQDKEVYRADQLVRDACDVKITPEILKAYTLEWEEKTRTEKEREAELEGLRTANINFAVKVRKLEERVEAYDSEQAALATELVHTKVENEELKDENESLKGQVRELRNVIEKQPEELENAWKAERDNLMQRNQNVHDENQKLEKELAELEEELVQTKMQYAEINSQHETLTRKWTDLKRQFT
ncbi:TBC domain-containing protein [Colletotrichum karsti]|uniref:GTPase-activating protein GYP5 n=1 Tax=Colletotrichum karsti TaxID=1095194 RepID=A0A9P6IAF0_9PEZI|nr:TBC domain-containing protein [Colletotrichum karsti]KAF9878930.1 TBC domain-containing protein [Colletotrichum karsti]